MEVITIQDVVICRCEEVVLNEIIDTIKNGVQTSKELKLRTRAGMGMCQGRTCRPLLEKIISLHTNRVIPNISGLTYNNPIRPVTLAELSKSGKSSLLW